MEKSSVTRATLGRLPRYLKYLNTLPQDGFVSSTKIAKSLSLGDVQVRKDLNSVSGEGRPRIGYLTADLIECIEKILGQNSLTSAVVVGAGRLGRALLNYDGFREFGIEIIDAFDVECPEDKEQRQILPMNMFEAYCKGKDIHLGIITVNEESAQNVCDIMVRNGIKAIWNFTPQKLSVPGDIIVKQENLALSLAHLNNQLGNKFNHIN